MSWLPSPVVNERTTLKRSARAASRWKVEPNTTPGIAVRTTPVWLWTFDGPVVFGSNVSYCDGPPCMNRKTTERSFRRWGATVFAAK